MRKVILYIAISLDGYLADEKGSVEWLMNYENDAQAYQQFIDTIDTTIMGRITYEQIVNELSSEEWPYVELDNYVFSSSPVLNNGYVKIMNENIVEFIKKLKQEAGKDIWIVGGAKLAHQLMKENLIDEYQLTFIPVLLGKGIPLFEEFEKIELKLVNSKNMNGLLYTTYQRKELSV